LSFDPLKRDVEDPGYPRRASAVEVSPTDARQPFPELLAQRGHSLLFGHQLRPYQLTCGAKTRNLVRRQRARSKPLLLSPSEKQGLQQWPRGAPYIESACALGSVNFVCRKRKEIDRQRAHINRYLSNCLRRVRVKRDTALTAQTTQCTNVLDHADLVVHMHD